MRLKASGPREWWCLVIRDDRLKSKPFRFTWKTEFMRDAPVLSEEEAHEIMALTDAGRAAEAAQSGRLN
jgi:hypothetical protein